ncbi:MAG: class I poly(R)-hydroxyalkanoic acid synthase [Ectothiorhodospiraceae bacterium]|nr:class I poly(R)-hydroxyalkanoic acid synthase [Chromatiales bacterium]MCP5154688.1 class I poly(R)-hydroxyalkanoic acid synthase [Ectothiorhodospiraceae bacterium]
MTEPSSASEPRLPDPTELGKTMAEIAARSQRLVKEFLERQAQSPGAELPYNVLDPTVIGHAFGELAARLAADPSRLLEAQMALWQDYARLWQSTTQRMLGQVTEPVVAPSAGDRRFKDDEWSQNPVFDYVKQSYLLASRYLLDCVQRADGLDPHTAEKVDFYTRQFVDAMAPTNFAMSNPQVLRRTAETGGENLLNGLANLLDDLERGKGRLRIKMTDLERFELGTNVAVTPGSVVFQNDLVQLLHYAPSTPTQHKRPLLVIPPWINKFYILDLRPKNSFIRWAVEQGHSVFVVSWVNPDARLADKTFDDYLREGPLAALDAIEQATGEREINVIGYCLGGTLLACTLAYLAAKGEAKRIKSATFFTTMVDFSEPGELGVFIDEEQLHLMEEHMDKTGYFEGSSMAEAFNLLRANDLIWSFVVNNYLLGQDPFPFDLLYWNSDSTRMPRAMHSFYLRSMYQKNLLVQPGAITLDGVPIDLGKVRTPVYILSTREDHIAPWSSTYRATQLYKGTRRFVLGMSGHIAGVINPPSAGKYGYYTGSELPEDPQAWLAGAEAHEGSWWTDWASWVARHAGKQVPSRVPGEGGLPALEDAPGSYVKVRAD